MTTQDSGNLGPDIKQAQNVAGLNQLMCTQPSLHTCVYRFPKVRYKQTRSYKNRERVRFSLKDNIHTHIELPKYNN